MYPLLIMLAIIGIVIFLGIMIINGKYWYKSKFSIVHLSNNKYAIKAGIGSGFYDKYGDTWTIPKFINKYCTYNTYKEAEEGVERIKNMHII